jgi:hypothetical protein
LNTSVFELDKPVCNNIDFSAVRLPNSEHFSITTDGYGATITVEIQRTDHYCRSRADCKRKRTAAGDERENVRHWLRGAINIQDVSALSLRDRAAQADGEYAIDPGKVRSNYQY